MTVIAAWVRQLGRYQELMIASDSRLSGGRNIEYCPKIIPLPRSDCAICFAGSTDFAYPLMIQISLAVQSYRPSLTRAMDLRELRTHTVKILNSMADTISTTIPELQQPDVTFLFGGYSWINKSFDIWSISFNNGLQEFAAKPVRESRFGKLVFGGDKGHEARFRTYQLLDARKHIIPKGKDKRYIDMEPFEIIRDMLRESNEADSIGGAPQLLKIHQHMNVNAIGVYWPNKESGNVSILGRPTLGYEQIDQWIIDPDTLHLENLHYSQKDE